MSRTLTTPYPSISGNAVLDRLMALLLLERKRGGDARLADELGVHRRVISNWRKRDAVDFDLICGFSDNRGYDLNFVLLGRELPLPGGSLALIGMSPPGVPESDLLEMIEISGRQVEIASRMLREQRAATAAELSNKQDKPAGGATRREEAHT